jgi:hypothetical protein
MLASFKTKTQLLLSFQYEKVNTLQKKKQQLLLFEV